MDQIQTSCGHVAPNPIQTEPGVFICQRCFRIQRFNIYVEEKAEAPWER